MRRTSIVVITLSIFIGQPLHSQLDSLTSTQQLKEIILSSSRIGLPLKENSRSIQFITAEELKKSGVLTTNEGLQLLSGIDIRQRGIVGMQADLYIRGGSFDQTLLLIDGIKLDDAQTGHHTLNFLPPLEMVERIEIVKGPAARIFGQNAFTGAINIGLTMGEAVEMINKHSKGDAVIVTDVGQHQMVACRYAKFNQSKSNVTSGGLGTMGFALPAAIGAKMGAMDREVVAVIGDGGYQMTIQELGTIFQQQVAVKIVVLNNDFLGMVRQWQQLFFDKRYASTEMVNPDFVTIAKGFQIQAKRVDERKDLDQAVKEMMAYDKPYFLEVCVEKEDNVFPMIPSGASVSDIRLE